MYLHDFCTPLNMLIYIIFMQVKKFELCSIFKKEREKGEKEEEKCCSVALTF